MNRLPNRAPNLSRLYRMLAHIGVGRVEVRFDERGAIQTATVVTGSLQNTVCGCDLATVFDGAKVLLVGDGGGTLDMQMADAIVAAARGDDVAGSTVTLDIRRHEITRTTPVTFVDPATFLAATR